MDDAEGDDGECTESEVEILQTWLEPLPVAMDAPY